MPATLEGRVRTVVGAIVVALILVVPLALLFAGGGDDGEQAEETADGALRVELSTTLPELIVSVEPTANTAARAGGARSVTLRCVDSDDQLVAAQDEAWPFTDTDGDTLNPHAHMPLDGAQLEQVSSCRLVGTEPLLEANLP
jgi:hypothetical protein